ncbi:MAG: GntG family PLP-dependent aldolase [Dehalococcoidia bacterium]
MIPVDLRSDTVSQPGEEMRRAIAEAELGDDVYGDDPSVNRLEMMAAERLGREAAVLVPSGTMANLVSVMTHTRPGDEILLGSEAHIVNYEGGGAARIAGVQTMTLPNDWDTGGIDPAAVAEAVRSPSQNIPQTALLCLENTHNRCGGRPVPQSLMRELIDTAHANGLAVHVDGARIFNAEVALGSPAAELTKGAESVSFCLSKGLGCPVGSLICGSREFIAEARHNRRVLGGGLRQAGIIAAAGVYALQHNIERLVEDHANAARLAEGLANLEIFEPEEPRTNILAVGLRRGTSSEWGRALRDAGVLSTAFGPRRLRFVTHINIGAADIEEALDRIERAVATAGI